MKTIKKFWGVIFVLALLSTLLVGAIPQAAASSYVFANARVTPSATPPSTALAPAGGFGIMDVAQSGSTIWAVASDNCAAEYLYKSADAGATWARVTPSAAPALTPFPAGSNDTLIAVAPDDPSVVVLVNTQPSLADVVYLSTNGGATFTNLNNPVLAADINSVSVSPLTSQGRYIAIGGSTGTPLPASGLDYLAIWTIGAVVPAWTVPATFVNIGADDVEAVAFSTNFLADQALLVLTETVGTSVGAAGNNGAIGLHVYSFNQADWDQNIDPAFPKYLVRTTKNQLVIGRAQIVLDSNFYLGDPAAQIGFIGANITSNVSGVIDTQAGGVFRMSTSSIVAGNATITQLLTGTAINSVAWDGTNLMAATQGVAATGLVVWRCANALATSGYSFLPNSTFKTPGTGNNTKLLFNGGNGFAFSTGNGACVAKSTDYGKSFNGITLLPFNAFGTIQNFWVSPDGSRMYAVTTDNVDLTVFRRDGTTWQRVFILAGAAAQNWMVRVALSDQNTVYLGRAGVTNMYKSTDAGDFIWTPRTSAQNIADFAVQDANTVYVARAADARVIKSTSGGFTWLNTNGVTALNAGNCFSLNLIAADNLIVGGTTGGFAYSTDGATTFTYLGAVAAANLGNALTAATGLATGDSIFVATDAAVGAVYRWQIGTTTGATFTAGAATGNVSGLVYANGVLYALDNGTNLLVRFLSPTLPPFVNVATDAIANAGSNVYVQVNMVNNLLVTTSGTTNTLWTRDWVVGIMPALDTLDSFTDYLTTAADAPVPIYPVNNAVIQINSISGIVNAFTFQWNAPASIAASQVSVPGLAYNYNLTVYLDAAGTIPFAGSIPPGGAALAAGVNTATVAQVSIYAAGGAFIAFAGSPATTYYWRVRVDAAAPAQSAYSPMQSFVIQQLAAIVPIISSPENGGSVNTQNPAFSWTPISNATGYKFELSMTANFSNIVYTVNPVTAGAAVPSELKLTRGMQYFWHVKALTPTEGEWSTTANFIVAELPVTTSPTPQVTITTAPQPTIIISQPPAVTTSIVIPPPAVNEVNPSYIWAIIIVGAVLVIAVIVLIVRTRRTV